MKWAIRAVVLVTVLGLGASPHAEDKVLFIQLPAGALPNDVSSSGVVVGSLRSGGGFHWMPTSGTVFIGGVGATTVSREGRTIAGAALDANRNQQAGIWQRGAEWRLLGSIVPNPVPCDDLISIAIGANDDGTVLVGLGWNGCSIARAFRWDEKSGMVDLGSTVPGRSSRADAVSGDGRVAVGWQDGASGFRQGARWIEGRQELFVGPNGMVGQAHDANTDGSIIVGQVCNPSTRWSSPRGSGRNRAASSACRRRVSDYQASFWGWPTTQAMTAASSPAARASASKARPYSGWIARRYYLKDYLRQHGVPDAFEGWVNTGAITAMSRDGRVLVGFGAGPTDFTGYVVVLPKLGDAK